MPNPITSDSPSTIFLIVGIVLLHAGLFCVKRGWFPRRVGNTPHCGKCDYPLTGIESDRCPECGQFLSPRTTVRGERPRRRGVGLTGVVVALIGVAGLVAAFTPTVRDTDWYRYKRLGWVLTDLESTNVPLQDRAWTELTRRRGAKLLADSDLQRLDQTGVRVVSRASANGPPQLTEHLAARFDRLTAPQQDAMLAKWVSDLQSNGFTSYTAARDRIGALERANVLSAAHHARLVEAAFAVQVIARKSLADEWLLEYLGRRERAGALAPAERDTFFTQSFGITLLVRPDMIAGENEPYWVANKGRGPRTGYWSRMSLRSQSLDDAPPTQLGGSSSGSGAGLDGSAAGGSIKVDAPGKHTLRVTVETNIFANQSDAQDGNKKPHWTREVTLTAPFETLPKSTSDYVTLIDDPAAADAIRGKLRVDQVRAGNRFDALSMSVHLDRMPYNVAFDVIARYDGKEYPVGRVYALAGESRGFGPHARDFPPGENAKSIDVIFRSSEKAAKDTTDIYQIWKGEVILKCVPVTPAQP